MSYIKVNRRPKSPANLLAAGLLTILSRRQPGGEGADDPWHPGVRRLG